MMLHYSNTTRTNVQVVATRQTNGSKRSHVSFPQSPFQWLPKNLHWPITHTLHLPATSYRSPFLSLLPICFSSFFSNSFIILHPFLPLPCVFFTISKPIPTHFSTFLTCKNIYKLCHDVSHVLGMA